MNEKCSIARDLMPLVIDEAASAASVQFVEEHTEKCGECAAYYQGMRAMLPQTEAAAGEKSRFSRAARKLRARRWKRLAAWVCAGVVLTLLLLAGVRALTDRLTWVIDQPMRLEDYEVNLSAMENGRCVTSIRQAAPDMLSGLDIAYEAEEGGMAVYFCLKTTRLPRKAPSWTHNAQWNRVLSWDEEGLYYLENGVRMPVASVRKGRPGDCEVVYLRGQAIPPASGGMEAYFAQWDAYEQMIDDPDDETWSNPEFQRKLEEQRYLSATLEKLVPEWNGRAVAPAASTLLPYVTMVPLPVPEEPAASDGAMPVAPTAVPDAQLTVLVTPRPAE